MKSVSRSKEPVGTVVSEHTRNVPKKYRTTPHMVYLSFSKRGDAEVTLRGTRFIIVDVNYPKAPVQPYGPGEAFLLNLKDICGVKSC